LSKANTPRDIREAWALRWPERQLLLWCLLCITLGFLMILGSIHASGRQVGLADGRPLLIYALCLTTIHTTFVVFRFRGDQVLPVSVAFLSGLGLLAQYRMGAFDTAAPAALNYLIFPAGILIMLTVGIAGMRGRYNLLAAGLWIWGGLSVTLVAILLITGQRFRGGVYAAGFITPTEILKLTVVLFLAGYIDRYSKALGKWGYRQLLPPVRDLLPLFVFWAVLAGLLLLQRDLGMFLILSIPLLAMLYLGTNRAGYLIYGVLATGLGYLALTFVAHGQQRIQAWQAPFSDPTGNSWQILQGLSGMYSGGLWGEGFGQGNPEYTPIAESDFIYSVIGEELGFIGCAIVVVFYLILFIRGIRIAHQSRSSFGTLLCAGLTTVLATQTFLNIGGVTKFIPLTGITLPFISHGGSSLLTGFASLGLILAISEGEPPKTRKQRAPAKRKASVDARKTPQEDSEDLTRRHGDARADSSIVD